jgi:Domain of unknown function (DUF4126)
MAHAGEFVTSAQMPVRVGYRHAAKLPHRMKLFLDICLGIGLALAVGLRPFLPALLVAALARGNAGIDFDHTNVAFIEDTGFLLALVIGVIVLVLAERRIGPERVERGPYGGVVTGIALGLGALLFGGALADDGYAFGPGLIGGLACAALAQAAVRGLFSRTRGRLDAEAGRALSLYADGAGLLLAGLSVLVPPISLPALVFIAWLVIGRRRREGRKFAGLRILR